MSDSDNYSDLDFLFSVAEDIIYTKELIAKLVINNNSNVVDNVLYWYLGTISGFARIDVDSKTLHFVAGVGDDGLNENLISDDKVAGQIADDLTDFFMVQNLKQLMSSPFGTLIVMIESGYDSPNVKSKLENAGVIFRDERAYWRISDSEYVCILVGSKQIYKVTSLTALLLTDKLIPQNDALIEKILGQIIQKVQQEQEITILKFFPGSYNPSFLFSLS